MIGVEMMKAHHYMREFIKRVSGQDNILTIPKIYLELTEDVNAALVLNQMIYYSGITKRKDGFFYKSYVEWQEETYLTQYQIKRVVDKLKEMKLVETKLKKAHGNPTLHYKIDMDELQKSIMKKLDKGKSSNLIIGSEETSQSLTETYTENYTSSSNAFKFYEENIGMITPFNAENINFWIDKLSEELVVEALKIAVKSNKKFNYAEGILKDWNRNNVKTVDDANSKTVEFENSKKTTRKGAVDLNEFDLDD